MTHEELRDLLERLHDKYNREEFITDDPISIPHSFSGREDIEISGLLAATIAWGNRKAIVKSARRMVEYMDGAPYDFTMNASESELDRLNSYVHRTFNGSDFRSFVVAMRRMYAEVPRYEARDFPNAGLKSYLWSIHRRFDQRRIIRGIRDRTQTYRSPR